MKLTPCRGRSILAPCSLNGLNYQIDPYIGCEQCCHYCYALNTAETDWEAEVLFHEDLGSRLETELSDIGPQKIYMGWETDPYQPCEEESRQTRTVLETLLEKGCSASILTKSDRVLRDLDLLRQMPDSSISFSIAFDNDTDRQQFEANTRDTGSRIAALETVQASGIATSVLLCPVIPYINDVMAVIDSVAGLADKIWIYGLSSLKASDLNWRNIEAILEDTYPGLKSWIKEAVFNKDHQFWKNLRNELMQYQKKHTLNLKIHV